MLDMIIATRKIKLIVLVSGLLQLTACSLFNIGESTFFCDDPDNVTALTCKTPTAVYKSTNGPLEINAHDVPAGMTLKEYKAKKAAKSAEQTREVDSAVNGAGAYPLPVRSAAQVMRIWIAPWEDKAGDLHTPGLLFTEVTPRKWNVGETEFSGNGVVIPHRVVSAASSAPANNAIGAIPTSRGSAYDSSPMSGMNLNSTIAVSPSSINDLATGVASPVQSTQSLTVPTSPTSMEMPKVNLGY